MSEPAVNLVLQSKGGVGKSIAASWIAEFLLEEKRQFTAIDADPAQKTLARIKALNARPVSILLRKPNDEVVINTHVMDSIFSEMMEGEDNVVFDCGSSGYGTVTAYLAASDAIVALSEARRVIVHSIVVSGRDHVDTIKTFEEILNTFPDNVEKVLWLNPHFGELEYNGTRFEDGRFCRENAEKISGMVRMPRINGAYMEAYFKRMMDEHLTFGEILNPENKAWNAMAKLRIRNIWTPIRQQLAEVL